MASQKKGEDAQPSSIQPATMDTSTLPGNETYWPNIRAWIDSRPTVQCSICGRELSFPGILPRRPWKSNQQQVEQAGEVDKAEEEEVASEEAEKEKVEGEDPGDEDWDDDSEIGWEDDEEERGTKLACGHVFGIECMAIWLSETEADLDTQPCCPICRVQLSHKDIISFYKEFKSVVEEARREIRAIRNHFAAVRQRQQEGSSSQQQEQQEQQQQQQQPRPPPMPATSEPHIEPERTERQSQGVQGVRLERQVDYQPPADRVEAPGQATVAHIGGDRRDPGLAVPNPLDRYREADDVCSVIMRAWVAVFAVAAFGFVLIGVDACFRHADNVQAIMVG